MKYKILLIIIFTALVTLANAATVSKSIGSFIEAVGEYEWSNFERIVLIEQSNERLQFSISLDDPERKKSIGPKAGLLQPGKPWMFWIESRNKIWMFDGDSRLWEYTFRTIEPNKYQDSIREIKVSGLIPPELARALPVEFMQTLSSSKVKAAGTDRNVCVTFETVSKRGPYEFNCGIITSPISPVGPL